MTSAAALQNVSLEIAGQKILNDVSLSIEDGQHWVLIGPNGAGKTTVARMISGREYPTSGQVTVLGQRTEDAESTYLASRVGFSSANVRDHLSESSSVLSLVLPAAWGQTVRFDEQYEDVDEARARDLLVALGIGDLADRRFGTLSEGEKQRVSIARALMADPEIVILDEPTAGLDLGARETLVVALAEIMGDPASPSVVMITHELEEIAPGFTHAALLREGKTVSAGPLDEVLTATNLSEVFGLELDVEKRDGRWWATAHVS